MKNTLGPWKVSSKEALADSLDLLTKRCSHIWKVKTSTKLKDKAEMLRKAILKVKGKNKGEKTMKKLGRVERKNKMEKVYSDLLKACKMALDVELNFTDKGDEHPGLIETLKKAIAKAEKK